MAHDHQIYDDDRLFTINTLSRVINVPESAKPVLMQYDHNSEHVTFECDRFVENHDFSLCDKVEIHYINVQGDGRKTSKGVYPVEDLSIVQTDKNKLRFTWVISQNATTHAGTLSFIVSFTCTDEGDILYRWNTAINSDLVISSGMNNGESVEQVYADVLEMWRLDLFGVGDTEEARMLLVSQQQQDAIAKKGQDTLATIPDGYSDIQNNFNVIDKDVDVIKGLVLNDNTISEAETVNLTLNVGYFMNNAGELTAIENSTYCVSDPVSVNPGDIFMVYGHSYSENPTYAFFDSYGNLVSRNKEYNATGATFTDNIIIIAPRNASTIRVNGSETYLPSLKRLTSYYNTITNYVRNTVDALINDCTIEKEPIELVENAAKCILASGKVIDVTSGDSRFIVTDSVSVEEGCLYHMACSGFLNCASYVFYNEFENPVEQLVDTVNSYSAFDGILVAPQNAKSVRLSSATGSGVVSLSKIVKIKPKKELVWSGKKWAAIGDSLTEKNQRATENYHDYIASETGIEVVNMGASGSGYLRSYEDEKAFYQRITSVPTDADVVTIFGSGNDLGAGVDLGDVDDTGTSTLCGAINTALDNLYEVYPLVKVGLITPTPWGGYKPGNGNAMELYSNAIVTICKNRGIPCLDLYHCSELRPWDTTYLTLAYSRDEGNNVHPDETGHAIIAPKIKAFLETLLI